VGTGAPRGRIGRRLLVLFFTSLASLLPAVLAQAGPGGGDGSVPRHGVTDLRGEFSVSYALALLGGDAAPNLGPIARADIAFSVGSRVFSLTLDPVGIRRQGVSFEVREGSELLSITHERTPSDGTDPNVGASTDLQALVVAKPEGAPQLQALFAVQSTEGAAGSQVFTARLSANERYRDPFAGFSSVDWRASVQSTRLLVPATGVDRTTVSFGVGAGAAFGGPRSRSLRPSLRLDVASDETRAGAGVRFKVDAGLAAELTDREDLSVGAGWDVRRTGSADSQRVSLGTRRLEPVTLSAEADRSRAADGRTSYRWGLGADVALTRDVRLGASYRGELDEDGSGHGARGRFSVRWQAAGFSLKGSLHGGAIWRSDGELRPDLSATVAAAAAGGGPVTGSLAASLRYQRRFSAALNGDLRVELGALTVDVDAEASYADALSLSGGLVTALEVLRRDDASLSLQLGLEGRTTTGGGSAASLDLGLRYGFGETR